MGRTSIGPAKKVLLKMGHQLQVFFCSEPRPYLYPTLTRVLSYELVILVRPFSIARRNPYHLVGTRGLRERRRLGVPEN